MHELASPDELARRHLQRDDGIRPLRVPGTHAAEEIRAADFAVYMSWPVRKGATYLALHETAHTTELGLYLNALLYDQFVHLGGDRRRYPESPQWLYNEATANMIARTVADAIAFPMLPHPTGGFPSLISSQMEMA